MLNKSESFSCKLDFKCKVLLVLSLVLGVVLRIVLMVNHFTTVDDVGLITSLLQLGDSFVERLNYREIGWTYAPFQVGMVSLLINEKWGYIGNLVVGRLPSLIFSIINLGLLAYLLLKKCETRLSVIFPLALLAFSWENIIFAAQAQPYSICATAMLTCLIFYYRCIGRKHVNIILAVAVNAWACYASYQMFMYVFALYISLYIFFIVEKNRQQLIRSIVSSILSLIACVPLLMKMLTYGLLEQSVNWNTGNNGRFLFQIESAENKLLYVVRFFADNTVILIRSFFVYKDSNVIANIFTFVILIAILTGIIYIHCNEYPIALFIDICLFITAIMILKGKLAYSPSRHSLVLEPIILFLIAMGIQFFGGIKKRDIIARFIYSAALVGIIAIFSFKFNLEFELRRNMISEKMIDEIVEKYNPYLISFYSDTMDLNLMQIDGYDKMLEGFVPQSIKKSDANIQSDDIVIFFSRERDLYRSDIQCLLRRIKDREFSGDFRDCRDLGDEDIYYEVNFIDNKKLELVTKNEFRGDTQLEYARGVFGTHGNGSYVYIYKVL